MKIEKISNKFIQNNNLFFALSSINANDGEVVLYQGPKEDGIISSIGEIAIAENGQYVFGATKISGYTNLYNLTAVCGDKEEVINLIPIERSFEYVIKAPVSSNSSFVFLDSTRISNEDWRCDYSLYGPTKFKLMEEPAFRNLDDIKIYEPIFNISGTAHIIYIEGINREYFVNYMINEDETPAASNTLQEVLKLAYEWSLVNQDPFNNDENISIKAHKFFEKMNFSEEEINAINNHPSCQVEKYLLGDENARQSVIDGISLSDDIIKLYTKRSAFTSFSSLTKFFPAIDQWEKYYDMDMARAMDLCLTYATEATDSRSINTLNFCIQRKNFLDYIKNLPI